MLESPPQGRQWLAWLYVVIWSLIIFVTIPLARGFQKFVTQQWSRDAFTYAVVVVIVSALTAAIFHVRRLRPTSRSSYFWLTAIGALFFGYTIELGNRAPEEAVHFIQYGMLGILVYRALSHRLDDISIYFAAAIVCGMIGTLDEFVQWLTPQRFWGLGDIWLNFFASALVQIAIAKAFEPTFATRRPNRKNLRFSCRLAIAAVALFGASLLMTPARIAWVAERISWLDFLKRNESVLLEYGYLYEDPEIGIFRSRFAPQELKEMDRRRAVEAAKILNRYQAGPSYGTFLSRYTPISDPFVHEARVHLFRRDRYFYSAAGCKNDADEYARRLNIAFRENQIMVKFFYNTLQHSAYVWTEEKLSLARRHYLTDENYDSEVSQKLITRVSEAQVACFFIVAILGLILVHWYLGRAPEDAASLEH